MIPAINNDLFKTMVDTCTKENHSAPAEVTVLRREDGAFRIHYPNRSRRLAIGDGATFSETPLQKNRKSENIDAIMNAFTLIDLLHDTGLIEGEIAYDFKAGPLGLGLHDFKQGPLKIGGNVTVAVRRGGDVDVEFRSDLSASR